MENNYKIYKNNFFNNLFQNISKNKISIISIFLMLVPVLFYIWVILRFTVDMPWWDDYDSILNWMNRFIQHHNNIRYILSMLLEQHNEHRILFDRILELLDYYLFGSINFLYLSFIGYLGLFGTLAFTLWLGLKKKLNIIELLPIPFLMLTLAQYELVSFAMASIQQYWQLLFSLVSICLISLSNMITVKRFLLSFLFAIAASFTGAGGLIVFPVVLVYLILIRDTKRIIAWLIGSILVFIFYFIVLKYQLLDSESHKDVLAHPFQYITYVFCFLGSITGNKSTALILGIFMIFINLVLGLIIYKKNKNLVLPVIVFFIFATACAAGLSRLSMGINEALSSRYTIYSATLLSITYVLATPEIKSKKLHKFVFIISILFSVFVWMHWISPGISQLKNKDHLLKTSFVYPDQTRAINILEESLKLNIFTPIPQIYKHLP